MQPTQKAARLICGVRRVRMIDLKRIDFGEIGNKVILRPLENTTQEDVLDMTPGR